MAQNQFKNDINAAHKGRNDGWDDIPAGYNSYDIWCNTTNIRTAGNNDFLQCATRDNLFHFELEFDDLTESQTARVQVDMGRAMCILFGGTPTTSGAVGNVDHRVFCNLNKKDCEGTFNYVLNNYANQRAEYHKKYTSTQNRLSASNPEVCEIYSNKKSHETNLNRYENLDPFYFCRGIQLSGTANITDAIEKYVNKTLGIKTKVSCNTSSATYNGPGCSGDGRDDYITCTINGKKQDFVFDDLMEYWDSYDEGSRQAVDCMAVGGNYTGKQCLGLSRQDCINLKKANLANCPECKQLYWDSKTHSCILPSSGTATNIAKGVKLGTAVGTMAAGVVITFLSGGSTTVVLIEGAGAAISSVAEIAMSNAAQEFLTRANQCKSATCAEKLIKEELQRMANLSSRFEDTEIKAIDQEFTRLVGLIPDNAQMYKTMLADNTLPWYNSDSWEPEQVWNAVGIGLQLASVIKTLWGPTTSRLTKTSSTLKNKIKNAKARFNRTAPTGKKVGGDTPNPGASSSSQRAGANRQSAGGARNTETGTGANNSSRAASNTKTGLHPDVQNFNKRQFTLKYHPDHIPPSLSAEADEITKMAADFDKLSDAQKLELSNKIRALEAKLPREQLAVTMARSEAKLSAMKNSINARRRTAAIEEAQTTLDELRANAHAAREAGFTKESDEADAMIKRMEDEINAVKNPPKQPTQPSKENPAGETAQPRQADVTHAEPAEAEVISVEPPEAVVIRAEPAAPVRPSALDSMKERTGLQNLVESNNNSAGVRQFRQLANSEEEADQIVARLQSQNIYAGKIQNGDEWYVAIVENADDYTKMQPYILPSKNIRVRMAGETGLVDDEIEILNYGSTPTDIYAQADDMGRIVNANAVPVTRDGINATVTTSPVSEEMADSMIRNLNNSGYYATSLSSTGDGSNYIVIAMSRSEAEAKGLQITDANTIFKHIDNPNLNNLPNKTNKKLGEIHGQSVYIESMEDFGEWSGRPIIMVRVGNRKIPFYASSGSAGKTDVATGKWEFFGGISQGDGWFNKGGLSDILNHYGSPELKQIADILDSQIGDVRNTEYVLETMGRQSLGGQGSVASLSGTRQITPQYINQHLRYAPSDIGSAAPTLRYNISDISEYLRNL